MMVMVRQPFVCTFLDHSMLTTFSLETNPILNDACQLQAYPFVGMDPVDLEELSFYGVDLEEFVDPKSRDDGKILPIKANMLADMKRLRKVPQRIVLINSTACTVTETRVCSAFKWLSIALQSRMISVQI
jgi:hypothetical protein